MSLFLAYLCHKTKNKYIAEFTKCQKITLRKTYNAFNNHKNKNQITNRQNRDPWYTEKLEIFKMMIFCFNV